MARKPVSDVNRLADEVWEFTMEETPSWATFLGDHRYDDRLEERGPAARERRKKAFAGFLKRAEAMGPGDMDEEEAITGAVLRRTMNESLAGFDHHFWEWDLNQLNGLHMELQDLLVVHPRDSEKGARDLLARYRAIPGVIDACIRDQRDGLKSGRVVPRVAYDRVVSQLRAFDATKPEESTFGKAARLPDSIPENARRATEKELLAAVRESVYPAYRSLLKFVTKEYEGRAREPVGVCSVPGGKEAYAYKVAVETTTDLTPEEIHEVGLEELETNKREMLEIGRRHGHRGDLRSYLDRLRDDPKSRLETREDLLERYRAILRRMDQALPRAFGILPKTPYRVDPMQEYKEKDAPAAYYYPPATDGTRPGVFYANTHDPPSWPTYDMETLSFHEAVPGHHLQIAIAQEQAALPSLRKHAGFTAYIEGWAHYSERLADEMEMFTSDEDRVGMLSGQAWRAARLVVDTGMHYYGWSREKAVDLLREIKTGPDAEVANEVDRYIVWPGQALAYKVGHRKIRDLREAARKRLGRKFDLRSFHDEVLRHGALPLTVLGEVVERWAARRAAG